MAILAIQQSHMPESCAHAIIILLKIIINIDDELLFKIIYNIYIQGGNQFLILEIYTI